MLRLEGIQKRYGEHQALMGLSLNVPAGTVFGFLGPNGAGKTTTMRIIAGLIQASHGRVYIDGIDTTKDPIRAKSKVGYIPDRPYLYDRLTGWETMGFVAELFGIPKEVAQPRSRVLLKRFSIDDVREKLTETYSHGMKQRLALAAALLHAPKLLLVDEPMVGLDPKGAKLVKSVMREEADAGNTVFLSTHSLAVAEEVCDHIGILQLGKMIALGSKAELQKKAGLDANLEEIFLKLTAQDDPLLRASLMPPSPSPSSTD
jgi:ABC-2 type transport system ATP-binding protein